MNKTATAPGELKDTVERVVAAYAHLEGPLLPILQALQAELGCIPRDAIPMIAHALNLTRAEVYGVVSFYHDFRAAPAGKRVVKLCRAEACQAMGANALHEKVLKHLKVDWGGTTEDGAVTVEPVYCLGFCSVAPAALVDGEPHGRLDQKKLLAAIEGKA
jgi:formate dehydrogenase subunit gamma